MRRRFFILYAGLLIGASLPATARAETVEGKVVKVSDGDTLTVLDGARRQLKVRVAGIDAPESRQPFGQRSKQLLSELAMNKRVTVTWQKVDRFGRVVGTVHRDDVDLGLEVLKAGLAWHFKRYESEQTLAERAAYAAAEDGARLARRGLWRENNPEAPWDYRSRMR